MQTTTTKSGEVIVLKETTTFQLITIESDYSHWGWWVFWLILMWPVLFILFFMGMNRKKYSVMIDGGSVVYWLDQKSYTKLCAHAKREE